MSQSLRLGPDGEPNEIDTTGICLLSLDGGGVRGLSTLYVLQNIMRRVNHERTQNGLGHAKPCEVFDLIGGTSTGGLIAIMLGRLEMDVDDCIEAYNELMEEVFGARLHKLPVKGVGTMQPRFDSRKLKAAIESVIENNKESRQALLNDGERRGCHVVVCTASKKPYDITRLRSYELIDGAANIPATICEAALATSAATGFFDQVQIGDHEFVDAALGENNPVNVVEREAADIWCPDSGNLQPLVKCFISIGTGKPDMTAIEDWLPRFLTETLVKIVTDTEKTATSFISRWRGPFDGKRYYRFNVEQGLQKIGLQEHKKKGEIERVTRSYLDDQVQRFAVRDCARNMARKQNKSERTFETEVVKGISYINKEDLGCLQQLVVVIPKDHMREIEVQKGGLLDDSFQWILHEGEFLRFIDWTKQESSLKPHQLLWFNGHAGTGKTMLLIGIIKELNTQCQKSGHSLCFFFCQGGERQLNNATMVLRSLIWQLLMQQPHLMRHLRRQYDPVGPRLFEDNKIAFRTLEYVFQKMTKDPELLPVYFIIDALDECENGIPGLRELFHLISTSIARTNKIRWLVSGRPEVDLADPGVLKGLFAEIELSGHNLEEAVSAYINHKITSLRGRKGYDNKVIERVSSEIQQRANGIFLWVAIVFAELDANNINGAYALDNIKSLPQQLGDLYEHIMDRIEKRLSIDVRDCKNTLVAVLLAYRPLSFFELHTLASLRSTVDVETVVKECGSFLCITEEMVHIRHQSAREYLTNVYKSRLGRGGLSHGHSDICRRSLEAIMASKHGFDESKGPTEQQKPPFRFTSDRPTSIKYYCRYWASHLCDSRSGGFQKDFVDNETILEFLECQFLHWIEALAVMGLLSDAVPSIRRLLQTLQTPDRADSNLVLFLQDAKRFVLSFGGIISRAPIQIYGSALTFSLESSRIKKTHWSQRLPFIKYIEGLSEHRDLSLQILEGHKDLITGVAFSPDGHILASSSHDRTVRIWNTQTGTVLHILDGPFSSVRDVGFSPDGKMLASSCANGNVYSWDAKEGKLQEMLSGHTRSVSSVTISPDGATIASASRDSKIRLWDRATSRCWEVLERHNRHVTAVSFSPDGTRLASSSHDNTVGLSDEKGQHFQRLEGHTAFVEAVAFSPDSKILASSSIDCRIILWDTGTGSCQRVIHRNGQPFMAIAFSPSTGTLASASKESVWIWDETYTSHKELRGHHGTVTSIKFSPDGNMLVSASNDKTVRLWDTTPQTCYSHNEERPNPISAMALSPDGSKIASASRDNIIQVYDKATGKPLQLQGHKGLIYAIRFSKNGRRLISASEDGTVRLWHTVNGKHQRFVPAAAGFINVVCFSPDGEALAAASRRGDVYIGDVSAAVCRYKIKTGKTYDRLTFSEDGMSLKTDHGRLTLASSSVSWNDRVEEDPPQPKLRVDKDWILLNGMPLLWLPKDYRPECYAIQGCRIAIECKQRFPVIIELDFH